MYKFLARKCRDNSGMSIVELMLVVTIFSVVVFAIMSLYIPAARSTAVQTQVSDVQSNLRLALRVMTQDLLHAGFMVHDHPIVFPDAGGDFYTPTSRGTRNTTEFIIRTRIVGNDFARITGTPSVDGSGNIVLNIANPDMVANFSDGSKVRLFEPVMAEEVIKDTGTPASRAYTVQSSTANTVTITPGALVVSDIKSDTVMIRVRDESQPALQIIHYKFNNGSLERIINTNQKQILVQNLEAVLFDYDETPQNKINLVDVKLTGKTRSIKDDSIYDAKTRTVRSSVKLRNVF